MCNPLDVLFVIAYVTVCIALVSRGLVLLPSSPSCHSSLLLWQLPELLLLPVVLLLESDRVELRVVQAVHGGVRVGPVGRGDGRAVLLAGRAVEDGEQLKLDKEVEQSGNETVSMLQLKL